MKTYMPRANSLERKWHLINADGVVLGRLAAKAASILRGKHKVTFTPHLDCGDGVVVINAAKVKVTGDKLKGKVLTHYSGYPGGLRELTLGFWLKRAPEQVIRRAVRGMLPKNRLGDDLIRHLKIYNGPEHNQQAQQPIELGLNN